MISGAALDPVLSAALAPPSLSHDTPMTWAALSLPTEEAVCVGMAVVLVLGALSCSQRGSLALSVCVSVGTTLRRG